MSKEQTQHCKRCGGTMKEGEALQNALSFNVRDFPDGDLRGQTYSRTGESRLVPVWKCSACGYSRTK